MIINKDFTVTLVQDNNYIKVRVTHTDYIGRASKNIGTGSKEDYLFLKSKLLVDLTNYFDGKEVTKKEVIKYLDDYIEGTQKKASIFTHVDEFLSKKSNKFNARRKAKITSRTIHTFKTVLKYFKAYLRKRNISEHYSYINEEVLNGYFQYLNEDKKLAHNTCVAYWKKAKSYINYLFNEGYGIHPSYRNSTFNERHEHLFSDDNDRALNMFEYKQLLELKNKLDNDEIIFTVKASKHISKEIRERQILAKKIGVKISLDCFLWMCSTGMYPSDVQGDRDDKKQSVINIHPNRTIQYRRCKNDSLCSNIPYTTNDFIVSEMLAEEYGIKNGENFKIELAQFNIRKHLETISTLAGLNFKLKIKYARKTFASTMYYHYKISLHIIQKMLGHSSENETKHYLRISDDDVSNAVFDAMNRKSI